MKYGFAEEKGGKMVVSCLKKKYFCEIIISMCKSKRIIVLSSLKWC